MDTFSFQTSSYSSQQKYPNVLLKLLQPLSYLSRDSSQTKQPCSNTLQKAQDSHSYGGLLTGSLGLKDGGTWGLGRWSWGSAHCSAWRRPPWEILPEVTVSHTAAVNTASPDIMGKYEKVRWFSAKVRQRFSNFNGDEQCISRSGCLLPVG